MKHCYFCRTIAGETPMGIIDSLQSEHFIFAWDHTPVTPGHALVIPRRHVQYMKDLSYEERISLIDCVVKLKDYISSADLLSMYHALLPRAENEKATSFMHWAIDMSQERRSAPIAFNDGVNDGPAAGQTIPHFHWHVMPRWKDDVADPVGGVRHMFPGVGNYLTKL